MRKRRPALWRTGALVTTLALAGLTPVAAAGTATKTRVETVYPWSAAGKLETGLKLAGTVRGTCWTSSIAVSAGDAYRCMSKSLIYDPCFAPPTRVFVQLACMATPWGAVVLFDLTASIPRSALHGSARPWVWAYRLADGIRCITDTGTGTLVDHVALNYYCIPGKGWSSVPEEKHEPWTAKYAKSYRARTVQSEPITTAWY